MTETDRTRDQYDQRYGPNSYYWTTQPSSTCFEVLRRIPPERPLKLLDIGCGEGRNAVFFARNGYEVHAFDVSTKGLEKTRRLAHQAGVSVNTFEADINQYRLSEPFDVLFSTGVLHCMEPSLRQETFENYKSFTNESGLHVFSNFVRKPFIPPAPDGDPNAHAWKSGELFTLYHDWNIEWCIEEIFDCMSSGVPHQHATNRIVARKP